MGGVFNSMNLGLYSYAHLNSLKFIDPDGNATGINTTLDSNNYFLVAQSRSEICGSYGSCQANAASLPESSLGMHPISNNGETMYLSPTWGDNKIYMDKGTELAAGKLAGAVDDVGKATGVKSLGALSLVLKGVEIAKSDDKAKTIAAAIGQEAGSKYSKALTMGNDKGPQKGAARLVGAAAEIGGDKAGGDKAGGNTVANIMDLRSGSARNAMKASEGQRQEVQQQNLKLLNGEN